uniref:Uncharacterized protein n=1 Tax=Opuntia streptacantha TaxID=393608 RepID=A0A7C8ZD88_OPUST
MASSVSWSKTCFVSSDIFALLSFELPFNLFRAWRTVSPGSRAFAILRLIFPISFDDRSCSSLSFFVTVEILSASCGSTSTLSSHASFSSFSRTYSTKFPASSK